MTTDLTGKPISSTYNQLLHVDGGPSNEEKTVYGGAGVATALKVGTESVSVDNVRIGESTITTINSNTDLVLAPNGSGKVKITRLEVDSPLSNVQISNANIIGGQISNANITGGQISNANITGGTFHGVTPTQAGLNLLDDADAAAQRATLGLGTIATQNANNVNITGGNLSNVSITGLQPPSIAGQPLIRGLSFYLPNNVDLNTIIDTGFYRLNDSVRNGPFERTVNYGQLIVSRGADTITQIVAAYDTGEMWTRSGNPSVVGGRGSWSVWRKMTLDNNNGIAPHYACRAWVCFDASGIVIICGGGNVSSVVDNGVGDFTVNFTIAMPDTNYSIVGGFGKEGHINNQGAWSVKTQRSYMTTGSVRIRTIQVTPQTASYMDPERVFVQIIR